jgi:16S rRNA A1518/A1519 N6-dimethyltransferase RsmA/KsgA/DIM1 with predicted DNA glycosylase/AP lyase activity
LLACHPFQKGNLINSPLVEGCPEGGVFPPDNLEEKFWQIVRAGFAHKRKKLTNNLKLKPKIFEKLKIPINSRAENLNIDQWKKLVKYF